MKALKVGDQSAFFYIPNLVFWQLARQMFPNKEDLATISFQSTEGTRLHISPETSEDGSKIFYDPKEKAHGDSPTDQAQS